MKVEDAWHSMQSLYTVDCRSGNICKLKEGKYKKPIKVFLYQQNVLHWGSRRLVLSNNYLFSYPFFLQEVCYLGVFVWWDLLQLDCRLWLRYFC